MSAQASLQELWLAGKHGGLSAREQLKAWALREVWKHHRKDAEETEEGGDASVYGMYSFIAERVTKVGGGHPQSNAVKQLLQKIDEDDEWFPGKHYGEKRGRKRVLTGVKALAVAACANAKKARGKDPTYGDICGNCKDAVINPDTGRPVDKRAVYVVFKERCYDDEEHPENTW